MSLATTSLSGFTIAKDIEKFHYPIVESINSLLPLVDEMIVAVGKSEDNTLKIVKSINSKKIKIFHRTWDESKRKNGEILSVETNFALSQISKNWGFYLQADEVIHEQDYVQIKKDLRKAEKLDLNAISFNYSHFKGDYWSINPWAYKREIRIIKNSPKIKSVGDACTFKLTNGQYIKTFKSSAIIYHYGWVKPPKIMIAKTEKMDSFYHDDQYIKEKFSKIDTTNIFEEVKILREFKKNHPQVMKKKIANFPRVKRKKKRWQYWEFYKKFFKYGWF